ncbi:hypothetical protein [Peribacillus glennii]|uniref:hypothetical protein n=1 Tax=Peribacillus glennii TaxID=2303991 RepID=UPI001314063B|nr:hypothetical protein [Peribacillus glennii]
MHAGNPGQRQDCLVISGSPLHLDALQPLDHLPVGGRVHFSDISHKTKCEPKRRLREHSIAQKKTAPA